MAKYRTALLLLAATAACSLDQNGLYVEAGVDAAVMDSGGKDVVEEPITMACSDAGASSCWDAVAFRTPALFSPDASVPCPAGYTTLDRAQGTPVASTCGCTCDDAGALGCDTTKASFTAGIGDCTTTPTSGNLSFPDGGCTAITQSVAGDHVMMPPPAVVGGCAGGKSTSPGLTSSSARLCLPCPSDQSACTSSGGLEACVIAAGNVGNCPPGFPKLHYIGSNAQVQCGTCSCSETGGDCTQSQFHWDSNTTCNMADHNVNMDGTCHGVPPFGFLSAMIAPNLQGKPTCNVSLGAASIAYDPGTDYTVCCP